jgi:Ala-tRNA(Pro) deacylase
MSLVELLTEEAVPAERLLHPPAYTAQRRAKYLHVPGKAVLKNVLLHGPDGWLLAVLPACDRLDLDRLAGLLGGPVRIATPAEVGQVFTDCQWGVAAPLGSRYRIPTWLDDRISADAVVVLPTQYHHESIRLSCADYERIEKPRRASIARREPTPTHRCPG